MKKISIITLQNINNYGSMLQAMATQKLFEECGCNAEIVDYTRTDAKIWNSIHDYIKNDNLILKILKIMVLLPTKIRFSIIWKEASKKYLHLTENKYYGMTDFEKYPIDADVYCVGSDQVWNSAWNKGVLPEFFLAYAPEEKRKVAFCSSIGKSKLDDFEIDIMHDYLKRFYAISVRENSACTIVNNLGITGAELLLDPTLLVNNEYWAELASKRLLQEDYVLVYQLNNNSKFDEYVQSYANDKKLKLIRVGIRLDQLSKNGKVFALPTIEQFLSLFKYCSVVITDSFHATAFSINFNKEFIVIYPKEFSSRLQSIMELTNTENRLVTDFSDYDFSNKEIDYQGINEYLDAERAKVNIFIQRVLEDEY